MKVAIAGPGGLARYLIEELPKEGHEAVVLTRSHKGFLEALGVAQRITDYSNVAELSSQIADCDALVCTIISYSPTWVSDQVALLEACKQSPKCKSFIPALWGGNTEDVPDQPMGVEHGLVPLLKALEGQKEVAWTMLCQGWFCDYVLPTSQRYMKDIGDAWPQNLKEKVFTMYGRGTQKVDFTSARDTAHATAVLLSQDSSTWEPYTYISGQQMTWYELYETIKSRDPTYTVKTKSLAQSIDQYIARESEEKIFVALHEILGFSEALWVPRERLDAHKQKFFKTVKFRSVGELIDEGTANPKKVI
ncbi:NAD(P)-binding protein [Corynespora cassiicola Philippines]|uniref:NAD(P)-binding protein n=1 Tax=Corynespora cassiicola Philippines TaxID=1448308 RepID=A0A2T2N021_CORCC|nr:NAD(P)-binding protein [Corynespora cassiicola Philippines]